MAKLVDADNFGRDYPDEKFVEVMGISNREALQRIANIINIELGIHSSRYVKVVDDDYELQPGFEP